MIGCGPLSCSSCLQIRDWFDADGISLYGLVIERQMKIKNNAA